MTTAATADFASTMTTSAMTDDFDDVLGQIPLDATPDLVPVGAGSPDMGLVGDDAEFASFDPGSDSVGDDDFSIPSVSVDASPTFEESSFSMPEPDPSFDDSPAFADDIAGDITPNSPTDMSFGG